MSPIDVLLWCAAIAAVAVTVSFVVTLYRQIKKTK